MGRRSCFLTCSLSLFNLRSGREEGRDTERKEIKELVKRKRKGMETLERKRDKRKERMHNGGS